MIIRRTAKLQMLTAHKINFRNNTQLNGFNWAFYTLKAYFACVGWTLSRTWWKI